MAETPKKQIPLRISPSLYDALCEWAEEDFRSVNGQIEYLLTQCLRYHQRNDTGRSSSTSEAPSDGLPRQP